MKSPGYFTRNSEACEKNWGLHTGIQPRMRLRGGTSTGSVRVIPHSQGFLSEEIREGIHPHPLRKQVERVGWVCEREKVRGIVRVIRGIRFV